MKTLYIVGFDEVGRGALAGPVVVAGVALSSSWRFQSLNCGPKLKDSKKLTPLARKKWSDALKNEPKVFFALARVYPRGIDRLNITQAANRAAKQAFKRLITNYKLPVARTKIYLDGGLFIGQPINSEKLGAKTIIKGDEKINAVKLASIIAKVARDKYMTKLHKDFPVYGFDKHKGYGTRQHRRAIRKYGLSQVHRLTFIH